MRQPLRTVSDGKLCAGFSPSSDACSTSMRWPDSLCCQGVKMLCRGRKKSKKPAGRSRVGSNGLGAVPTRLTGLPISDAVAVICRLLRWTCRFSVVQYTEQQFQIRADRRTPPRVGQASCSIGRTYIQFVVRLGVCYHDAAYVSTDRFALRRG